ncbi:PIG-L family deacetylase [Granulicella sp. 5B5]|uniref:PIG-L deacetylase family protein n=1 Tax=Granulicella sp. 5B5 TaxID=1617967 RepID=UPI0015F3D810|nr:PIG-L family deacetylase [Granulicella sp. 5B5]
MCVVAHPDDECVGFGGALALANERGAQTSVICLTDGQAATNRGDSSSAAELGAMRRAEFAASCKVLGTTEHELLDYQDAQLEFASVSEMAGKLVGHMRRFRPQIVITFSGDGGMNTHPDHSMVSFATTAAFHWAGSPKRFPALGELYRPQRLYYLSTQYFLPERLAPLPPPWSLSLDIGGVFVRKLEAFRAHSSQAPLIKIVEPLWRSHPLQEVYTLAAATEPQSAHTSTDLFEGIVVD